MKKMKWLFIAEKKPEENEDILVCGEKGDIYTSTYTGEYHPNETRMKKADSNPIAWMSLPDESDPEWLPFFKDIKYPCEKILVLFLDGSVAVSTVNDAIDNSKKNLSGWMFLPEPCRIIKRYKYLISFGILRLDAIPVRETEKAYIGMVNRFLKSEDGVADIKDRTCYPYITFYSTKDPSREFAVKSIRKFLAEHWGLE